MEEKTLLLRYATYKEVLERIGSLPLSQTVTLDEIGDKDDVSKSKKEIRAITQRCYRDMESDDLKMPALDYLFWISAQYLLYNWDKEAKQDYKKAKDSLICLANQTLNSWVGRKRRIVADAKAREDIDALTEKVDHSLTVFILFLMICKKNIELTRNMLRLFNKNAVYLTINDYVKNVLKMLDNYYDPIRISFTIFEIMNILHFYEFSKEELIKIPTNDTELKEESDSVLFQAIIPYGLESLSVFSGRNYLRETIEDIKKSVGEKKKKSKKITK